MMAFWFASRAAGVLALVLLTGTVVIGVSGAVRYASPRWPRFVLALLHRNLALLTVAFLVLHVSTAVLDGYAGIRWIDTVVPFVSGYEPFWLGLGVVAAELFLAMVVTSLLRPWVGLRTWRAVHWAAYVSWPVAVIHGLGIGGQDTRTPWILALTLGCVALLLGAAGWRLRAVMHPRAVNRAGAVR
ncbi:ferric reductase-like transmembrane domain-containing protein [Pseudonocardia aurantiaca]